MLIAQREKTSTYFCLFMAIFLFLISLFFVPQAIATTGFFYKVREFALIIAMVSFAWTFLHKIKIWDFQIIRKVCTYFLMGSILLLITSCMFLYHGLEERANKQLQTHTYQKK